MSIPRNDVPKRRLTISQVGMRRRLGSYSAHRRCALRNLRADCFTVFGLLPWRRVKSSALFAPVTVVLTLAIVLLSNPHRVEVLANSASLLPFQPARHVERFVPLTP
jgi:hypothetical protein